MSKIYKEASYYKKEEGGRIRCELCPFNCRVKEGVVARCMGRENVGGIFYAKNYGKTTSLQVDPIEKKPLYHFHPGSKILSIAGNSCNLGCTFCQNWSISQEEYRTKDLELEELVNILNNNKYLGVAYTYSEPLMWYEYVYDSAKKLKQLGYKTVLITNGTINKEPLKELLPYIDGINIDLKGIESSYYKKVCKGLLEPVLENIKLISDTKREGQTLELTNLLIPTLNDSKSDISQLIDFIYSVDKDIPLHLSAYHPDYKLKIEATGYKVLKEAYAMAKEKLNHVYVGNARIEGLSDTYCSRCKCLLIKRDMQGVKVLGIAGGCCSGCGSRVPIVM